MYYMSYIGLGFDSYRIWEALILGTIPIVESNEGFDRTYSNLPVLVIKNYQNLTSDLLDESYRCFIKYITFYSYEHLTQEYWLGLIKNVTHTGSIDLVTKNHPYRNKYCDFLS